MLHPKRARTHNNDGRSVSAPRNVPVAVTLHLPRSPLGCLQAEAFQSVPAPARARSANSQDAGLSSGRPGNGSISFCCGSEKLKNHTVSKDPGHQPVALSHRTVVCKLPFNWAELRMTASTLYIHSNGGRRFQQTQTGRLADFSLLQSSLKFNFKGDVEEKGKCFKY